MTSLAISGRLRIEACIYLVVAWYRNYDHIISMVDRIGANVIWNNGKKLYQMFTVVVEYDK